jgi:hypothetical protein
LTNPQTVLGVSVVPGKDFERLKRYNLAEIMAPTPKPAKSETENTEGTKAEVKETGEDAQKPVASVAADTAASE